MDVSLSRFRRALLAAALALPVVASAGSVEGIVFESGTGLPLADVTLTVGGQTLTTDADGGFAVELEHGVYDVVVGNNTFAQVVVGKDGVTEVLVTLAADGLATAQIEAPDASTLEGVELQDAPRGTVSGVLVDDEEGKPIAGARIFVKGFDADARSAADGSFTVEVPAGSWELSIIRSGYATRSVVVEAVAGEVRDLELEMVPTGVQLADFTVTAPAIEGNTASLLAERQDSSQVADVIGAEQMSKTGDSNAASALRRVAGLTLIDGKYVIVRGLDERYSAALVNGATLPSPDPERRILPLDLFPASMLDSIVVQKTFSPDMPGDFGGGVVRIRTRTAPRTPFYSVKLTGGIRTDTTFRQNLDYAPGKTDWIGIDGGHRALPDIVREASNNSALEEGDLFSDRGYTPDKLEEFGESMANVWTPEERTIPLDMGMSMQGGGSVGTDVARFGLLAGFVYDNSWTSIDRTESYATVGGGGEVSERNRYVFHGAENAVRLGGMFTASAEIGEGHELQLTTLVNRISEDEARTYTGYNGDVGGDTTSGRLRWVERQLLSEQVLGRHEFDALEVDWRYSFSTASRLEPDRRTYRLDNEPGTDVWRMSDRPDGNQRFFSDLQDRVHDVGLDVTFPFELGERALSFKVGASAMAKDRLVDSRRFKYMHKGPNSRDQDILAQTPEEIFQPENIGTDGFQFEEITRPTDNYSGSHVILASYAMADVEVTGSTRVSGGARIEHSSQKVSTFALFDASGSAIEAELVKTDVLPALTVTQGLGVEGMQLRAGYGRTLNRPMLRELSPSAFSDVAGGRVRRGNPDLERATIDNYDLRWEYYPSQGESVSVALFYKRFTDPLEWVSIPGAEPLLQPFNALGANNYGVEIDGRKDLGFFGDAFEDFFVAGNVALINSRVRIDGDNPLIIVTNDERPLASQSPYMINLSAGWDDLDGRGSLIVAFNNIGSRIVEVGSGGLPDALEAIEPQLDLIGRVGLPAGFSLSAKGRVPLRSRTMTVGNFVTIDDLQGVEASLSIGWKAQAAE